MTRPASNRGALLRLGFTDGEQALDDLTSLGDAAGPLTPLLGRTADPDGALAGLIRLAEAVGALEGDAGRRALLAELVDDEGTAMRLLSVMGASAALAEHLARHPEQWRELTDPTLGSTRSVAHEVRAGLLRAVGADPDHPVPVSTLPHHEALDALRVEYRRVLMRLAARDLAHHEGVDDVAAELADLAAGTLDAALAVARTDVGEAAASVRLAVIAMGKCGGHELNYVSDVDVLFVHEPADGEAGAERTAARLAGALMRVCSDHTGEGTIWPVDAALRPEGKAGPLSRTLESHRGYYESWAKGWEFQALLKARPVAGDLALGQAFVELTAPLVWTASRRPHFVEETRAMRRRVIDHLPAKEVDRQLKLGPGGLRDVEFAVQLLQLVHGRVDDRVRQPTTLSALAVLTRLGYVGREDGESLHEAYSFLRQLEHRIQLYQLRRTHVVPEDEQALRRLGRGLGFERDPAATVVKVWQHHRREVRRLHEKLFYRPLLESVARMPADGMGGARLSSEAAGERLAGLGYDDPQAALRNLEALTGGVTRSAAVQRALLPAMLGWFAEGPDPDAGLFGFRRISEAMGSTPWYLKTLRDEGQAAERMAHVLSTSRYLTALLEREPEGVRLLATELRPLSAEAMTEEMLAAAARRDDVETAVRAVRAVRRRELLRIGAGDALGLTDVAEVGAALSRLTDATLEATLHAVERSVCESRGLDAPPTRLAVVAMGRYGGFELSYGSDADVLLVHEPLDGVEPQQAAGYAQAVALGVRDRLAGPGSDPPLTVDADLRPEGKNGPLVRTLGSYAAYYAKWSKVWEAQALLRADAVVGDPALRTAFTELIDPLRFPTDGISADDVVEVRRIKARIDNERLPKGADPQLHVKLGRGGLADIEWTVQLLQMRHAGAQPTLRTPRTLDALRAAVDVGLVGLDDAQLLADAWRSASRVRNAATLVRGKLTDQVPRDARERAAMAAIMGYPAGETDAMLNDHLRAARLGRGVVERLFWE